jgi:hypothetical protein
MLSSGAYGIATDEVLDVLKKSGMIPNQELKLVGSICRELNEGKINLKDLNKMAEKRNFPLLEKEWRHRYVPELCDPEIALRKFELAARDFSGIREDHALALATQSAKTAGIDAVTFVLGGVQAKRADLRSDVDIICIVGYPSDVPKAKLLLMLAQYYQGEVFCPSLITSKGIRSKDELSTAATYTDMNIMRLVCLELPCQATSKEFLEEILNTLHSGVKRFCRTPPCKELRNMLKGFATSYRREIDEVNVGSIQFLKILKFLDLGLQYSSLGKGLTYASEHPSFWDRLTAIPSRTKDYKQLESDLGRLLIEVRGESRGSLNLYKKEIRKVVDRIFTRYCRFNYHI